MKNSAFKILVISILVTATSVITNAATDSKSKPNSSQGKVAASSHTDKPPASQNTGDPKQKSPKTPAVATLEETVTSPKAAAEKAIEKKIQKKQFSAKMVSQELKLKRKIDQKLNEEQSTSLIKSLKYKETQLKILKERFESYDDIIFSRLTELTVKKEKTEIRFFELKSLLEVSNNSPYEFQMIYGQLLEMNNNYKGMIEGGCVMQRKISDLLGSMKILEKSIDHLATKELSPGHKLLIQDIKKRTSGLLSSLDYYHALYTEYFTPVKTLALHLQASIDSISKQSNQRLINQFLRPTTSPLQDIFWNKGLLKNDLSAITPTAQMALWEKSPDAIEDWIILGVLAVSLWLPCHLLLRYITGKKLAFLQADSAHSFKHLINGIFFISTALFLYISLFIIYFPDNLLLTSLAIIFTAYAALKVIIAIKSLKNKETSSVVLIPFFHFYIIAVFFQLINLPMRIFTIIWFSCILFLLLRLYYYQKLHTLNFMGKLLTKLFIPFAILNIILILMGYLYLSHFLYKAWFIGILSFSLAVTLSRLLKDYASYMQREKGHLLLGTAVNNIGIPLLWFFTALIVLGWLSQQLGHTEFSMKILTAQLAWRNTKLDIITISVILLLFFLCKTVNNAFYAYLNIHYKSAPSKGLLPSIKHFISYSLWIIYVIIAFQIMGINMTSLSLIIGGISMGVGFGLRDIVNNFIGGIVLIFNKDIRPTDIIQLDDGTWAQVININFRSIVVRTYNNAVVSIPNSKILSSKLTNWSLGSPEIKIEIPLKLPYANGFETIEKRVIETALECKNVLTTPAPTVLLKNVDKDTMELTLNVWFDSISNIDDVNLNIASISELRKKLCSMLTEHDLFNPPTAKDES